MREELKRKVVTVVSDQPAGRLFGVGTWKKFRVMAHVISFQPQPSGKNCRFWEKLHVTCIP